MLHNSRVWKMIILASLLLSVLGITRIPRVEGSLAGQGTAVKPAAEAPAPGSEVTSAAIPSMTPEEERARALRYLQSSLALFTGRYMYMLINMRAPQSFEELCNGPYMPVPCDRVLVNPYTGARIRGEPGLGEFWFGTSEKDQERGLLQHWFLEKEQKEHSGPPLSRVLEVAKRMRVSLEEERARWKESQEIGRLLAQSPNMKPEELTALASRLPISDNFKRLLVLSPEGQRAFAVGLYLRTALMGFYELTASQGSGRFPETLSELFSEGDRFVADWIAGKLRGKPYFTVQLVTKVAILKDALINDSTGKVAQETNEPSPGNYRYYRVTSTGYPAIETYAENGVVASRWDIHPAFHRSSYNGF